MKHLPTIVGAIGAVALCLGTAKPSLAQSQSGETEGPVRVTPGWVLTPTVAAGVVHDDNPVLAAHGEATPSDVISNVRPGLDLTFTAKHAFFGTGYRGLVQRYRTFDAYDSYDQGGYAEFRGQPSRRVSLFARNSFSVSPTTDLVELAGIPFTRTGTTANDLTSGITTALSKRLQLTGSYHFQYLEFDRPSGAISTLLQGGQAHGVTIGLHQSLSNRLRVGGDYTVQRATVGRQLVENTFTIQNAEGVVSYQASPTLSLEGGAGISRLQLPDLIGTRTGPAGHAAIRKRTEYALFSLTAMGSYVPAFGFGGSIRNREVVGSVRIPFARRRAYIDGGVAWRQSQPVLATGLSLKSVWLKTMVGYSFQRWLRLEGFYNGAFQDTPVAGGRVDRNRIGVQIVTAHPMRLR